MLDKAAHNAIHFWLLNAIAFTMPLDIQLNSACIITCLLNLILSGGFIRAVKRIAQYKSIWMIPAFYGLHLISLFFSSNIGEGTAILERKLVLFVFPIILFQSIPEKQFKSIGYTFVSGVSMAICYCILKAFLQYNDHPSPDLFYYHTLSNQVGMHAVYLSCYAVFGIFFLLYYLRSESRLIRTIGIIALFILTSAVVLLSSKMMLFILVFGSLYLVSLHKHAWVKSSVLIALGAIIVLAALNTKVKDRFLLELKSNFEVVQLNQYAYNTPFTGTTLRLTIWKYCFRILSNQNGFVFGVGTGDVQDLLDLEYQKAGMYTGNPDLKDTGYLGYGPHNQYIDTLVALGLIGLLFLLWMLAKQCIMAIRSGNQLFVLLMGTLLLFFLSESVLNTNKGVVFYAFFMVLFQAKILLPQRE